MSLRYEVVPGPGLVARYAENLLWVGEHVDPVAWEALSALLQLEPGTDPTGADTAGALHAVQRVLGQYPHTTFAAIIVHGDSAQGLLRGPVTVRNQTEAAPTTGHGQLAITVPFTMSEAVYVGHGQPMANPQASREMLDLDAGVVPGGGAWVHPSTGGRRHAGGTGADAHPDTATAEAAPAAADLPVPPQTGSIGARPAIGEHSVAAQRLPEVVAAGSWAGPAGPGTPPHGQPAPHEGEFSPAPDYQRIDLRSAAVAGPPQPLPLTEPAAGDGQSQPPPSSGAIVFEDGSAFALDRDYVVGRRPEKDPRVHSGQAAALTIADPDTVLSSAHALVAVRGGQVTLTDLGSLNGTHIAPPDAQDWTRLEQFREVPIAPGTRLLFGWTVATYSGNH